jgi:glycosyltransferase involved in cell wall biosynthesis
MRSKPARKCLTIVIPAYNEEEKLGRTVREAQECAARMLDEYEIVIVDDGSVDGTLAVAESLAAEFAGIVNVRHFPVNRGVGAAYIEGLKVARFPFLTLIPGDNAFNSNGLERIFAEVGEYELVVSYRSNPRARTFFRRVLSIFATWLVRGITGRPVRDAHSLYVFPVALARAIPVSPDYSYHLESLCRLLLMARNYVEVPIELNPKPDASSGVMRLRTLCHLGWTVLKLYALRVAGRLTDKP